VILLPHYFFSRLVENDVQFLTSDTHAAKTQLSVCVMMLHIEGIRLGAEHGREKYQE
jgi:hypothetical protein